MAVGSLVKMADPGGGLKTGVSIILRDALAQLEPHHCELHPVHAAAGIPLHITLLFPFVPRSDLTEGHERRLADLFRNEYPFEFELASVECFPSVIYAVPSPDARLRQLMRAVWQEFPETPPYGGAFSDPPPHATIALVKEGESVDQAARRVASQLSHLWPVHCSVTDVSLMEEYETGHWREARSFALGPAG